MQPPIYASGCLQMYMRHAQGMPAPAMARQYSFLNLGNLGYEIRGVN